MTKTSHFDPALFAFLRDLGNNNNRDWFNASKTRYIGQVRDPMLDFIADFAPYLKRISDRFVADPRTNGGSLFRIYRDVRFARDKKPYKTNAGAHFRHQAGRNAHAPGFYLHMEPGGVFAASGVWRPDGPALAKIRTAIDAKADLWKTVSAPEALGPRAELAGESLKRPPRGYDPDHPLIDDLKRKDFFAIARFTEAESCAPGFIDEFAGACRTFAPMTEFLTVALEFPW